MNDMPNPMATPPLALIAPIGGFDPQDSFIKEANRIMRWCVDQNGGAHINEAAVDRVDRMVVALIRIRNGWCDDPKLAAAEALS
jgi:hypothetical protein